MRETLVARPLAAGTDRLVRTTDDAVRRPRSIVPTRALVSGHAEASGPAPRLRVALLPRLLRRPRGHRPERRADQRGAGLPRHDRLARRARRGRPTSSPAGTTTGGPPSASRRSRPTRRTAWPRPVDEASTARRCPTPWLGAGADHRRRAHGARHRAGRHRRPRGRRRHRHPRDDLSGAGCRSTSSPGTATSSSSSTTPTRCACSTPPAAGCAPPTSSTRPSSRRSTASAPARPTPTWRCCGVTRVTACPASPASARRRPPS